MTKFYKFTLKYYCAVTDSIDDVYGIVPADNYGDAMDALNHRFNGNITTITITEMEDDAFLELTPFGWENLKRVVATEETNEPLKEDEIVKEDGPANNKTFEAVVYMDEILMGKCLGHVHIQP